MILLIFPRSRREQVALRQAETRRHDDAIPTCQMIGEDAVNRALRKVIQQFAYAPPPYPTSYALLFKDQDLGSIFSFEVRCNFACSGRGQSSV
jgi:hypothetical protein